MKTLRYISGVLQLTVFLGAVSYMFIGEPGVVIYLLWRDRSLHRIEMPLPPQREEEPPAVRSV